MAKAVKAFQCPHCGRRTEAKLVNDIAKFGEDCYECQQCYQIIKETSIGGWLAAGAVVATVIVAEANKNKG